MGSNVYRLPLNSSRIFKYMRLEKGVHEVLAVCEVKLFARGILIVVFFCVYFFVCILFFWGGGGIKLLLISLSAFCIHTEYISVEANYGFYGHRQFWVESCMQPS